MHIPSFHSHYLGMTKTQLEHIKRLLNFLQILTSSCNHILDSVDHNMQVFNWWRGQGGVPRLEIVSSHPMLIYISGYPLLDP